MRTKLLLGTAFAALLGTVAWAQSPGVNSPFNPVWSIPIDSIKRTYSNSTQLSPGAFATDISTLCGAASLQTKLTRVTIEGRAAAVSPMDIYLVKRSNWDTTNTAALSTVGVPYDANDAASQAAVTYYVNASNAGSVLNLGTLVGVIALAQKYVGNLTTGTAQAPGWVFDFGDRPTKAPTLRSATQCLALNLSGTSQGGNLLNVTWEWTEEP